MRLMIARIISTAAALLMSTHLSVAGDWPEKPVNLVVPFKAGGISDIVARKLAPGISENLGTKIVVVNVGGHSSVGTRRVVDATADGYEFLVHEAGIMTAQASGVMDFGYRDLKPVAAVSEVCLVVVARADSGWKTVKDVKASKGDTPLISGVTIGGASHMGILKAAELGGFKIRPVQAGGSAAAYASLIGGQIDLMITAPSGAKSYFYDKAGKKLEEPKAIPLLYLGGNRHPGLPDIEAMKDVGSDETMCIPNLVFAPKGTPDKVVAKMAGALKYSYKQPGGLLEFFTKIGGRDLFVAGAELPEYLDGLWNIMKPLAENASK